MPRRVFLADVRNNDQYLRATWHPETSAVVLSHWVGEVCVASTPVGINEASKLIGLLVGALQETADRSLETPLTPRSPAPSRTAVTWERIRQHFRPKLAKIITIHRDPPEGEHRAKQNQ